MPKALRVCSQAGCPELTDSGRCTAHRKAADRERGTPAQRGYGTAHRRRFRPGVLLRDPICVCEDQAHGHGVQCWQQSTVADHWPLDRKELVRRGMDANDPAHGRGLCAGCHGKHTAEAQPGGFRLHDG